MGNCLAQSGQVLGISLTLNWQIIADFGYRLDQIKRFCQNPEKRPKLLIYRNFLAFFARCCLDQSKHRPPDHILRNAVEQARTFSATYTVDHQHRPVEQLAQLFSATYTVDHLWRGAYRQHGYLLSHLHGGSRSPVRQACRSYLLSHLHGGSRSAPPHEKCGCLLSHLHGGSRSASMASSVVILLSHLHGGSLFAVIWAPRATLLSHLHGGSPVAVKPESCAPLLSHLHGGSH